MPVTFTNTKRGRIETEAITHRHTLCEAAGAQLITNDTKDPLTLNSLQRITPGGEREPQALPGGKAFLIVTVIFLFRLS